MSEHEGKDALHTEITFEFSRPVDLNNIPAKGRHLKFQATDEETSALVQRYAVQGLDGLIAECDIIPARKGEFKLKAIFKANILQACGISLDPVSEAITGEFTLALRQPPRQFTGQKQQEGPEIDFDFEEEDFEILKSNMIDVGEMIAQHLSLEINPYPRSPDATGKELGQKIIQEEDLVSDPEKVNPFDVLKSIKHKT